MNFEKAVEFVFESEGFYSNDMYDSGGETKYGISKKAYPDLDIKNLTQSHAEFIYEKDYWMTCKCMGLPSMLRLAVFDCAVNQGVSFASRALQELCGVVVDGVIGPKTIDAIQASDHEKVLEMYLEKRLDRYMKHKEFQRYGKGWVRRLLKVALNSKGR